MPPQPRTKTLGPYTITVGPNFDAAAQGLTWLLTGLKLETMDVIAVALDALLDAGVDISDEQYQAALLATVLTDARPQHPVLVQIAQATFVRHELQRLRAAGVDIPLQPWEQEAQ